MRHLGLVVLSTALAAANAWPASAQLFGEPPPRTILLSPGWHLSGPPVRSSSGLHLAVRNDAGVMQDMTVLPNGSVTFAPHPDVAKPARPHKAKPTASIKRVPGLAQPGPASTSAAPTKVTSTAATADAPPARPAPVQPERSLAPPASTQPAPSGPGFAHGVPINPLD